MSNAQASLAIYRNIAATRCLTFVGFTILVYDHLITFPDEVAQVWSRPKNTVSLMFLFNRYLTPLILMVDLYEKSGIAAPLDRSFCAIWLLLEGYIVVTIFSILHGLVAMRVCALYGHNKRITILLKFCWLMYVASVMTLASIALIPTSHDIGPDARFNICFAPMKMDLWVVWLPSLLFEILVFFLTVVRVIKFFCRDLSMPITKMIYRDGIVYFFTVGAMSLLCLLDWLVAPATLNALTKYFGYAVCVCASSKLVLNLRALAPGNDVWSVSYDFMDPESGAAPLLASVGAPKSVFDDIGRRASQSFCAAQSSQPSAIHESFYMGMIRTPPRVASRRTHASQRLPSWRESMRSPLEIIPSFSDLYPRFGTDFPTPSSEDRTERGIVMTRLDAHISPD